MIYFILNKRVNAVKIGVAYEPSKRLVNLQVGSVDELELIATYGSGENEPLSEAEVHAMFNEFRLRGEWFKFSEEIKSFIEFSCKKAKPRIDYSALKPTVTYDYEYVKTIIYPEADKESKMRCRSIEILHFADANKTLEVLKGRLNQLKERKAA